MNAKDFKRAFALANKPDFLYTDYPYTQLYGYALPDFVPCWVTIEVAAATIKYECIQFNGQWDGEALETTRKLFKHRVHLLN